MNTTRCKVCGNTDNNSLHEVKEMQLGLREPFIYQQCGHCGCLQLQHIPADLGKYYPNEGYYSFNLGLARKNTTDALRRLKASYLLYGRNKLAGKILSIGYKTPDYYAWLKIPAIQYNDSILDVGAGNGRLLMNFYKMGFTRLTGIDPFIDKEQEHGPFTVYKQDIFHTEGAFDYIMLHHAFEHMDDPLAVLQRLKKLLNKEKYLLIRTPMMGMYSWKKFGVNWMDIDAPRHIIIHTPESMKILALKAGLEIRKIVFDENYMSLIGSEQYSRGIALPDPASYTINKEASGYTKKDIVQYKKLANRLNEEGQADQAAFYLYKP